ncbi:hypothetical protein DRF58_00315 [Epilithonimonas hispanica]|uniref:Uncharacterized protein n=1 Tax=Epilithonimonas hispanica TaxID=358687 RepID=A0A3D9D5D5_9FLAO|nr:hypothetical protein DRF58_00315 [Epilithonimonas hispanica]
MIESCWLIVDRGTNLNIELLTSPDSSGILLFRCGENFYGLLQFVRSDRKDIANSRIKLLKNIYEIWKAFCNYQFKI